MSLSGLSSPRAAEPKRRTPLAANGLKDRISTGAAEVVAKLVESASP
jgi:hypothetical protein